MQIERNKIIYRSPNPFTFTKQKVSKIAENEEIAVFLYLVIEYYATFSAPKKRKKK
jgi:hypothetical protein